MVFVVEGNWLGFDWAAVAAIATAIGLPVAAGAALLAWRGVSEQIRQANKQHVELLTSSLRPLLDVRNVFVAPDGELFLFVVNAGVGPAVKPRFSAWALGRETTPPSPFSELATGAEMNQPDWFIQTAAMPPGHHTTLVPSTGVPKQAKAGLLVVTRVVYYDIFGHRQDDGEVGVMWAERNQDGSYGDRRAFPAGH